MNVIKCVVTDSPTPMLKYRHLLSEEYSHIVPLPLALHVANLLSKDICKLEGLTNIVKGICKIMNFFTKSHKWFHSSKECAKKNKNNKYSFQSLCETHWYSMCKVCMSMYTTRHLLNMQAMYRVLWTSIQTYPVQSCSFLMWNTS